MTCKIVKKLAAAMAAVVVAAGLLAGCSEKSDEGDPNDPNNPNNNGGGGLVGDWSAVSQESGDGEVEQIPDNYKAFFSFSSSNIASTEFQKVSDFWIESKSEASPYTIKGDSVCVIVDDEDGGGEDCIKYSISGNTLTLSFSGENCFDGECYTYSSKMVFARGNLASTRASLGKVYSQDPALSHTEWTRPSEFGYDRIEFWSNFYDNNGVYISRDDGYYRSSGNWYTESGNRLTLLGMKCDRYETVKEGEFEWESCVAQSVSKTVKLDYQLSNGNKTLKLRRDGSTVWDEWALDDGYSYSQSKSKANPEKAKRAVGPFELFRR